MNSKPISKYAQKNKIKRQKRYNEHQIKFGRKKVPLNSSTNSSKRIFKSFYKKGWMSFTPKMVKEKMKKVGRVNPFFDMVFFEYEDKNGFILFKVRLQHERKFYYSSQILRYGWSFVLIN